MRADGADAAVDVKADVRTSVAPGVRFGGLSFVWRPWVAGVTLLLAVAGFLVFCLSIGVGDFPIALPRVVATVFGGGEQVDRFVIMDLRMPRALAGLVVGVALGVSGALTQSIARNPLASPDVLGITSGAGAVAVFLVTVSGGAATAVADSVGLSAAAGGRSRHGAAGVLHGVAPRDRRLPAHPHRHLGERRDAGDHDMAAGHRRHQGRGPGPGVAGGLAGQPVLGARCTSRCGARSSCWSSWPRSPSSSSRCTSATTSRRARVRYGTVRAVLLLCAVLLAGVAVSAAGPVPFVALVAPQVAMRLARCPTPPLVPPAWWGRCC